MEPETKKINGTRVLYESDADAGELLSERPPLLIRSGLWLLSLVLLIICAIVFFVRVPDAYTIKGKLIEETGSVAMNSPRAGQIEAVFVVNQQHVEAGQVLASFEADARVQSVLDLSAELNEFEKFLHQGDITSLLKEERKARFDLGELQLLYQDFEAAKAGAKRNTTTIPQAIAEAFYRLKAAVMEWKHRYLFVAPISGSVRFASTIRPTYYINESQEAFVLDPPLKSYRLETYVQEELFSYFRKSSVIPLKVKVPAQDAVLELQGNLASVAGAPSALGYPVTIHLNDKSLAIYQWLENPGSRWIEAEVALGSRSLISNLFR